MAILDAVDIAKADEEEREQLKTEHEEYKKAKALEIFNIKDEIDTILNNPNMIA